MATRSRGAMVLAALAVLGLTDGARADNPIDSVMDASPELPVPRVVKTFPKDIATVWMRSLDRPNADSKVSAARSIALAHRLGLTGLNVAVPSLVRELDRPGQHPTVRLAVARALVALDARQAADSLFLQLDTDAGLREIIDPALARWDYPAAREAWLIRLGEPAPYHQRHMLAIRGLGVVREQKAIHVLRPLATTGTVPQSVRLEAARALASISRSGLEKDAAPLAADPSPPGAFNRLIAATLLRQHEGDEAVRLLQSLGRDSDPAVAAVALARLTELDPGLLIPILDPVLASPDANVRMFGVETLFRRPSDAYVKLLGDRLSDPHPEVRSRARVALRELAARSEFRAPVIREGTLALGRTDWRGQEQAAILLGQLDHKPAAKRLLELLRVERDEPMVASAWALRRLAVPDTLPPVLEFVRGEQRKLLEIAKKQRHWSPEARDRQLSQLVQFMGQALYQPANATLLEMLPRLLPGLAGSPPQNPLGPETRAAAVWALGLFNEGKSDPALATELVARITDLPTPGGAEYDRVRRMAAIALGRMKATDTVPVLKHFYDGKPSLDRVHDACGWALSRITGSPFPPGDTIERTDLMWFLVGID